MTDTSTLNIYLYLYPAYLDISTLTLSISKGRPVFIGDHTANDAGYAEPVFTRIAGPSWSLRLPERKPDRSRETHR